MLIFFIGAVPTYNCYTEDELSSGITDINCTGNSHDDVGVVCQGIY